MKTKLPLIFSAILSLAACSNESLPTPNKLSQNVQAIPPHTVISAISKTSFAIPKNSQSIVKMGKFKVVDNVYDPIGHQVLIPRGAIIDGLYSNDGTTCEISWKTVYSSSDDFDDNQGSIALGRVTNASVCNPQRGVKSGERVTLTFRPELDSQLN